MPNPEILKRTNCRLCGYLCGLTAHIVNGQLSAVEPDPTRYPYDPSIVKGCRRFLSSLEILDHPRRCNYPQKRIGERGSGEWQQVSWEEALDEIAARLRALRDRYGPETLASSIGGARAQYWPLHRFLDLFGSPNNVGIGQICWNLAIWINSMTYGSPLENELVPGTTAAAILWGLNPAESDNSLFWRNIIRFKQAGGQLAVVDPRRTRTAAQADLWLGLRPATDGALALGLLNVILAEALFDQDMVARWCSGFDELQARAAHYDPARVEEITGIDRRDIVRAARLYATCKPAALFSGRGIDQMGRDSAQTLRALAALRAVTGNLDVPGASHLGEKPDFVPEVELELGERLGPARRARQLGGERYRLQTYKAYELLSLYDAKRGYRLPMRYLTSAHPDLVWQAMLTGEPYPIRALIVMASNPLLSQANSRRVYEALKGLDLLVALELFPTPTAMLADYILPIAGTLERPVLQTNAGVANIAYGGDQAIEPLYERRTDFYFWRELGFRMGQQEDWPWRSLREAFDFILAPTGLCWEEFCVTGLYGGSPVYRKYEQLDPATGQPRGFATPSGKVELYSNLLAALGSDPLPSTTCLSLSAQSSSEQDAKKRFPLLVTTGARKQPFYASEFRQVDRLRRAHPLPVAETSAVTAEALGLAQGDVVWIETDKGQAEFVLQIAPMVPNLISVEYGWWFPEYPAAEPSLGGVWISNANVLTSADADECDPLLGQWSYTALPCRVRKVAEAEARIKAQSSEELAIR